MKPTAPSYVERPADREFLQQLAAGQFCFVLTSRQMGKSSLMARTAVKLREAGTLTAIVDLTGIGEGRKGGQTAGDWYYGLARTIARELGLKTDLRPWWQQRDGLPEQQRFTEFLEDLVLGEAADRRVVLFVDEIDTTLKLPFTDDFFAGIRACYNARATKPAFERLTFALLGVASPDELIKDARRTPFNIGHRIELNDFTEAEAAPLAAGLPLEAAADQQQALRRVLHWTGGQPYLTQKLCLELSRRLAPGAVVEPPGLGVRQSSVGFPPGAPDEKRQRTAALQDAGAPEEPGGRGRESAPTPSSESQRRLTSAATVDDLVRKLLFSPEGLQKETHFTAIRDRVLKAPHPRQVLRTYRRVLGGNPPKDNPQSLAQNALKLAGLVRRASDGTLQTRNLVYDRVFGLDWVRKALVTDPTRRRAFLVGALAILLIAAPMGLWYRRGSEEARTKAHVATLLAARPESVPEAIKSLIPLRARAEPLLQAGFEQAQPHSAKQLNAALGLAAIGIVSPLQELTRRDPNPTNRTAFIHGYCLWSEDLLRLPEILASLPLDTGTNTVLADFRSALCAALALASWQTFTPMQQETLLKTMQQLFTTAPDGGTHSAAAFALTSWTQSSPGLAERTNRPVPGRDWFVNRAGMTMIRIPAGKFQMGSAKGKQNEKPVHEVTLTNAFFLSAHEVTVALFQQSMNQHTPKPEVSPANDCPVQDVTWFDAVEFCNWLSRQEGHTPCYTCSGSTNWVCDFRAIGYRLPTEAEWEYACRAVSQSQFTYGDDEGLLGKYAWYGTNVSHARTWPAGTKLPNLWGLYGMHGNGCEWCWDWYAKDYYERSEEDDPLGPAKGQAGKPTKNVIGAARVLRGGSWQFDPASISSSSRSPADPSIARRGIGGFRCVLGGVSSAPN